ncbi:hypothetical protein CVT25_009229 [Psilocybe cyanescens]|uniref:Uncharacterized protein n=1 Tax=Psilocybe cyanescens TaxID=93625 RepID=A0A409WW73_PSICY|nr:hypothetical protein CVT25_009229 [Psilocybe cyanescens]
MDVDSPSVDTSQDGELDQEGDESEQWRKSRGMGMGMDVARRKGVRDRDRDREGVGASARGTNVNVFETREELLEKDNLKWPAGEGWKPLLVRRWVGVGEDEEEGGGKIGASNITPNIIPNVNKHYL